MTRFVKNILVCAFILSLFSSCQKELNVRIYPYVESQFENTVKIKSDYVIEPSGNHKFVNNRVEIALNSTFTSEFRMWALIQDSNGNYSTSIGDLIYDTIYYYRVSLRIDGIDYQSEVQQFKTPVEIIPPPPLGYGEAGGLVIFEDGLGGGIEVAPNDCHVGGRYWGCQSTFINYTQGYIGSGQNNTNYILGGCSEIDIAARDCANYTYNGYDDWYLPSLEELKLAYNILHVNGYGDFEDTYYHSSTQYSAAESRSVNFYSGQEYVRLKGLYSQVRAVRTF